MPFKLVYYSQQDPQWKNDILGFGEQGDTIGYIGCALTSVAMLLSGHGYTETPKSLNQKLKSINGFAGAGIRWGSVSSLYPQVNLKSIIPCADSPAPLAQIDASLAAGQPAVVMVDSTPAPGLLTHWVVLYARKGDDYLMLDPWPYQTDVTKETLLMPRYSQGNPLQRSIMHIILYECYTTSGPVSTPTTGTPPPAGTSQIPPVTAPVSTVPQARVKADVTWGLNIRTSIDTSNRANIVATVPAGTQLNILESDGAAKIGAVNQWVRVREPGGKEGYAAAWYLEKVPGAASPVITGTDTGSASEAGGSVQLTVVVKAKAGRKGLPVYKSASKSNEVIATEKFGTRLVVLEEAGKARPKIGKAGKWLNVKASNGRPGYVKADFVKLV